MIAAMLGLLLGHKAEVLFCHRLRPLSDQLQTQSLALRKATRSHADDAYLMLVNAAHPARTIADLKRPAMPVALGADNAASSNLIFALIAKEVLGLNVNVVRGYTGAAPLFLAMQRGEGLGAERK